MSGVCGVAKINGLFKRDGGLPLGARVQVPTNGAMRQGYVKGNATYVRHVMHPNKPAERIEEHFVRVGWYGPDGRRTNGFDLIPVAQVFLKKEEK